MNALHVRGAILACLLLLLFMPGAWAQSGNGSIEGIVTDPSGAVVAGATINVRDLGTDARLSTQTNAEGLFRFAVVPVGRYEVRVEHAGFATLLWNDVRVTVGANVNLSSSLKIATKTEAVVVRSAPVVETTRSGVSSTVPQGLVEGLPVNGRDFLSQISLTPAVKGSGDSYAGQRVMNSVLVDGADNNDIFNGLPLGRGGGRAPYQYSKDAVREFQVIANAYPAEFGRAGGIANTATKSGTNKFHGAAFEFYRDKSMNANDLINKLLQEPKSPFHFHQFGGNLGGRILRDKLFFFFNYDGQRNNSGVIPNLQSPPSCGSSKHPIACEFALTYLNARVFPYPRTLNQNVYFTKLDWHITPAHSLTGGWNRQRFNGLNQAGGGRQQALEHTGSAIANTDVVTLSVTSAISPSTVSVARVAYFRSDDSTTANSTLPSATILNEGQTVFTVGRNPGNPSQTLIDQFEFSQTLDSQRGRHGLKTGLDFIFDRITSLSTGNFFGSHRFACLQSFGESLLMELRMPCAGNNKDSFLQSFVGDNEGQSALTRRPDVVDLGGFVSDEWRARPNLTLNLGLRYDAEVFARPPVQNPKLAAMSLGTSDFPIDKDALGPRVGIAWVPLRRTPIVVHSGYGIVYARTLGSTVAAADLQNGISVLPITFSATSISFPFYPLSVCGSALPPCSPPPSISLTGINAPGITLFSRDYRPPYLQQGNLGIEVQVAKDLAVSVSYLVVKGTHLQRSRDINLPAPSAGHISTADTSVTLNPGQFLPPNTPLTFEMFPTQGSPPMTVRPIPAFNRIVVFGSDANSIYHGLAVQVRRRFSRNFQFLGSYTFSKVIDDNPDNNDTSTGNADPRAVQNPLNARDDRSAGVNDQRHRFVFSGEWRLDYAQNLPRVAKAILGNWGLSGIFTAQTGQPYSGLLNSDLNNDGNMATDRTPGQGRNTFYLPRTVSLDPKLARDIRLKEGAKLQLAWEAFNVLNRSNITGVKTQQYAVSGTGASDELACGMAGTPCLVPQVPSLIVGCGATAFCQTAFGAPAATSGPRIMQLSAKFIF